jgi:hypothetical protein
MDLHPAAIADLIRRLEDIATLASWYAPEVRTVEERMTMELARYRCLEAAAMIANLAEQQSRRAA